MNLWEGITDADADDHSLRAYLRRHRVQRHAGTHNLLSSWAVCANLYFPFRRDEGSRALLADFLRHDVSADIAHVDDVELEYEFPGDLCPAVLLGEAGGKRGCGQTSPDVAFLIRTGRGGAGVVLAECKFTEHSFYSCSGRTRVGSGRSKNPDPTRCRNPIAVLADPGRQCHVAVWGRRYWKHLTAAANVRAFGLLSCCPAAMAGYQLFRQQALAEGIATSGGYELVVSSVAYDERNDALIRCLRSTGIGDFRVGWGQLFRGDARFATFSHQRWVAWVRAHAAETWAAWLQYVGGRYGY